MKMKFVRNGHTQRRELVVASQRGETLNVKSADKLADDSGALLLQFSYERQKGSSNVILHYDVEGLWCLRTYLSKRALSVEELMGLLEATERVLDICSEMRLKPEGLLFDPEYIFVDAQCCPHFALIVLDDVPFQARNSPLMLLRSMTAERVRYATPDATDLARRIGDLVVDLDGVFSMNRFRRFVGDERRQDDVSAPEARHSVVEPGTSSVWATAGSGAQGARPVNDASLFWSPLVGMASEPVAEQPAVAEAPARGQEAPPSTTDMPPQPVPQPVPQQASVPEPQSVPVSRPAPSSQPVPVNQTVSAPAPQPAPVGGICLIRPATGERFVLPLGQQVQAGRGSGCAIRLLGNRKLSRVHVTLTNTGQMVMVSDIGAVNGVFVNGQRLGSMQSRLVTVGQGIRLADEDFVIVMG